MFASSICHKCLAIQISRCTPQLCHNFWSIPSLSLHLLHNVQTGMTSSSEHALTHNKSIKNKHFLTSLTRTHKHINTAHTAHTYSRTHQYYYKHKKQLAKIHTNTQKTNSQTHRRNTQPTCKVWCPFSSPQFCCFSGARWGHLKQ